jgi:cobalt-zinc-cadmium efflux system protein
MAARGRLALAFVLSAAVAALEFAGGAFSHSLALTTDAVHVCMDVLAGGISLGASIGATRRANRRKTFGYGRLEVLGALLSCALLVAASGIIVFEAIGRFGSRVRPSGTLMLEIAAIALVVNITVAWFLSDHHRHHHDLNVRAALVHAASDALASFSVLAGGALIVWTGATWIDPLLSLFVAVLIVAGITRVVRDAGDVLLEGAPAGVDVIELESRIRSIGGVHAVHDLHVWSIASGSHALSAHVLLDDGRIMDGPAILAHLRRDVHERYGIGHVTIQLESEHCDPGGIVICRPEL